MTRRCTVLAVLALLAAGRTVAAQGPPDDPKVVAYELKVTPDAGPGHFDVTMDLTALAGHDLTLKIPAWKPGAYRIESWQERITGVSAKASGGAAIPVERAGERSWRLRVAPGGASLRYHSYSTKALDDWMCCEGPSTFLYADGHLDLPCRVSLRVPDGWKVATGMSPTDDPLAFSAPDYDTMADCPIELGDLTIDRFELDDVSYFITYNRKPRFDREKMIEVCRDVVRFQTRIFGGAPFTRYFFMWHLHNRQEFTGGLEHLNSTTLMLPQFVLRRSIVPHADLIAHEFFHLWNVKRFRPAGLGPFDYEKPVRVRGLWLSEGITSYYAALTCVRTGIWPASTYRAKVAGEISSLRSSPYYGKESVEDASLATWDRSFFEVSGVDYYNMGQILGLLLDIEIRHATENQRSLDDVMRALLAEHGLPKPGFTAESVVGIASRVAGRDLSEWFARYVAGRADVPFEDAMRKAGMKITETVSTRLDRSLLSRMMPDVEVENRGDDAAPRWTVIKAPDGPFEAGDVLLKFGRYDVRAPRGRTTFIGRNMRRAARRLKEGDAVAVKLERGGESHEVDVPVPFRNAYRYRLDVDDSVTDDLTRSIRSDLFEPEPEPAKKRL